MNDATYYRENEAEDAMSVLAKWMGQNYNIRVIYHDGTAVEADIFKGVIRIPRLACASGITQEALMLLRSRVYHEAGHIDDTKLERSEDPQGALHEIWNALEDRRMETVLAGKHKGCEIVFRWAMHHYNKKISEQIAIKKTDAPLWESLVAMMFVVEGMRPLWSLTPKAQDYFDAAIVEFGKVKQCKNAREALDLAKVIYKILKDVNEEWKQSQQGQKSDEQEKGEKGDQGQQGDQDDQQDEGEKQDQKGKGNSKGDKKDKEEKGESQGGGKDFDDYENEKPGKDKGENSSDGDQEESKDGTEKKGQKKSSKKDDGKDAEKSGKAKSDDSDADDSDGEGDESDGSKGKQENGNESGKDGDTGADKDGLDGKESDQDGKGEKEVGADGDAGDETDNDLDSEEGEEVAGQPNGEIKPGDMPYQPKDEEPKGGKGDGKDKRDLEDEMNGISKEQAQNADLEEFFKNIPAEDKKYLSRRDLDTHSAPVTDDEDKTSYRDRLAQVSVTVATMTRTLEQALRSMSKCQKNPFLRYGDVDFDRLVDIAKGLSKEVFFDTRDGKKLDVAVAITIDESGSMSNYYEVQLLAMAIGEALHAIKVPFEIIGSTTAYSGGSRSMVPMDGFSRVNPIVYKHYKLFSEQWGSVRQRLVKTGAHNHNVDGEVVEYAAFRLQQRKERRKVIFSLSDGEPCAGHMNDTVMAANLIRVCKRVRKQGVEVYGFGVGTATPRAFYGKDFFVELTSVGKMGQEFVREFSRIITNGKVKV